MDRTGERTGERTGGLALFCRTSSCVSAFPVALVQETMRPMPVTPLAGLPSCALGVALIRGKPTLVIDAGELVTGQRQERPARYVTLKLAARQLALAVDEVIGFRALPANLPPLFEHSDREVIAAMSRLDSQVVVLLAAASIVPDSVWSALETMP